MKFARCARGEFIPLDKKSQKTIHDISLAGALRIG